MTPSPLDGGLYLSDEHRHMLEVESGINPMLHYERGCFTATLPAQLKALGYSDTQAQLVPALVFPSYGVDLDQPSTFSQIRPDNPRETKSGKPRKYEIPAGASIRLDVFRSPALHKKLRDPNIPIYITEGFKKGDALWQRGLASIALAGVNNYRGKNEFGGIADLPCWSAIPLNGRTVYIVFDNDVMTKKEVIHAMRGLARMLKRKGASRVIPLVPALEGHDGKLGVDDFFVRGGTIEQLLACAKPDLLQTHIPDIQIAGRHSTEVFEDALDAVIRSNNPARLFVQGGNLVRVIDDDLSTAHIESVNRSALRTFLSSAAQWQSLQTVKGETVPKNLLHCPPDIAENFYNIRSWPGIPPISGMTRHPILIGDQIVDKPGYCPDSKYFIVGAQAWPEWEGTAKEAAEFITDDLLVDFCFKDDASRAHAVALMLLPIVRPALSSVAPLHVIDAPIMNSAKSLLARVLLRSTQGPDIAAGGAASTEEEWEKSIVAMLRGLPSYAFLDDLGGRLSSNTLNRALTSMMFRGRILGTSEEFHGPSNVAWVVTSNNLILSPDLAERALWIRLDTGMANPGDRTDFKHPQIEAYADSLRDAKIIPALVAMVRHYFNSGYQYKGLTHAKCHKWSFLLGGILEANGIFGFMENFKAMRETADPMQVSLSQFVGRWWEHHRDTPVFSSDLIEEWEADDNLAAEITSRNDAGKSKRFGLQLTKLRDRTFSYTNAKVYESDVVETISLTIQSCGHSGGKAVFKLVQKSNQLHQLHQKSDQLHQRNQVQKVELVELVELDEPHACTRTHDARAYVNGLEHSTDSTYSTKTTNDDQEEIVI